MSEEKKPPTTFTDLVEGIGMDVFEVTRDDPEGVVEFWVQWDHIVQRRASANDGDPWEVIYSGIAQRGTTLRTR